MLDTSLPKEIVSEGAERCQNDSNKVISEIRKDVSPAARQSTASVFFPDLDGFRFLSFMLVFLHHAFAEVIKSLGEGGLIFTTIKIGIFQSAPLGVSFFFVLSGFLITYLILIEQNQRGQINVKAFYLRRILRIWPLHYALVLTLFILLPIGFQIKLPNPLYYIFFFSNFDLLNNPNDGTELTNIMWSVAVEEQFYLIWPLIFYFFRRKYQVALFVGIIIGSSVFRWVNRQDPMVQHFHTLSVISELAIGGLAAYCSINFSRFYGLFVNISRQKIIASYCVVLPAILFSRILYANEIFGRILLAILLVFIILEQNFSENSFYKMRNFLSVSSMGKYTYGLYLLHPLAIFFVYFIADYFGISRGEKISGTTLAMFSFFLTIIICYASYHYYEKPLLRIKNHYSFVKTAAA